jgi:uncharacterized membrane protein YsdA (DUF1294 family)
MEQLLIALWAGLGLVGLVLMGRDKLAARFDRRRTPERAFRLLAASGGGIGVLIGVVLFRHKTRKPSFLRPVILLSVLNALLLIALWIWLH